MTVLARGASWILIAILSAAVLGFAGPVAGALQRPSYSPGDRWVFVLDGSLTALPGVNATDVGEFRFDLLGRVDVEVVGLVDLNRPTGFVRSIQVVSRTTGFLNGSFSFPGGPPGTARVTGTFTSSSSEFWEAEGLIPIESHTNSSYDAEVTFLFVTLPLNVDLRLDTATSISSIPAFDLEVGERASTNLTTQVRANSTVAFFGETRSLDNETDVSALWHREVVAAKTVTVEAGSFASYELNQSLGTFPGIPVTTGNNETAYFSNEVGFYVKRVVYENDTPVAEMRLKSYSYAAAGTSGWSPLVLLLLIAVPAALALVAFLLSKRRAPRQVAREDSGGLPPPSDEEGSGGGHAR